ncbi:DUF418 domain-containing protein [Larkinella sp.]|uniref:DUF418 domain-containing protein n=1 Tax=Larkinella sp. TaxID=2034517 RepID=UPI003BAD8232
MVFAICHPFRRITTLDVLGGLALLGLLIAQAYGQLAGAQPANPLTVAHSPAELPAQFMVQLLVAGQFERMGSFLVGLGFYRCFQPAGLDGPRLARLAIDRIVRRQLLLVLGIGLGLSLLLGSADLLVGYGLLGLTLVYFRNQSVASLLGWMMGLSGLAIGIPCCLFLLHSAGVNAQTLTDSPIESLLLLFVQQGKFGEGIGWQPIREWVLSSESVSQGFSTVISYELMMLGGLLAGKLGRLRRDLRLKVRLSLVELLVLPAALLFKGVRVLMALGLVVLPKQVVTYQPMLLALSDFLGPLLLTGVYVLDVGVNVRLTPTGWASWLGRVGQMSLSNYVFQSILCRLLLDGFEFVVPGPIPVWARAGIVGGIFACQVVFSWVWGRRNWPGPLEWICCRWIYPRKGRLKSSIRTEQL